MSEVNAVIDSLAFVTEIATAWLDTLMDIIDLLPKDVIKREVSAKLYKYLADKRHSSNVGSMLVQRLRRWPNIEPTLAERLVFENSPFSRRRRRLWS